MNLSSVYFKESWVSSNNKVEYKHKTTTRFIPRFLSKQLDKIDYLLKIVSRLQNRPMQRKERRVERHSKRGGEISTPKTFLSRIIHRGGSEALRWLSGTRFIGFSGWRLSDSYPFDSCSIPYRPSGTSHELAHGARPERRIALPARDYRELHLLSFESVATGG